MKLLLSAGVIVLCLLAMLATINGQSVTGQISGTVTDQAGAVMVGVRVQLTHDVSQQVREFTTETNGSFVFTGLVPGSYSLHVAQTGFKAYDERAIIVAAQERVDLHDVRLSIGDINQSVEVSAQTVHVATDSSDRSVAVNLLQIEDTPIRGRDFLATIKALPGVQDLSAHDARGWGVAMPTINGGQMGQTQLNLDGIAAQDSGNLNPGYMAPSIDAIAEVRLVVSNFTAEYGGRTGGTMQVSIKGGSNQYHGSAYYYWRHEQFNANEFFNNAQRVTKPRYRYSNPGGTFGGPLIIPGTNFNKSRTKLFFFFSADSIRNKSIATNRFTMPTALERTGDFSQTVTSSGALIPIIDPTTGKQYQGNMIPKSALSPAGLALMNLFPLPDPRGFGADPSGSRGFNSIFNVQLNRPNDDKILRVDYNIGRKTTSFVRLLQDYQAQDGFGGTVNPVGGVWGQFPASYHVQAAGVVGTVVHTFSPTLVNEFTWGINRGKQGVDPIDSTLYQKSLLPLKDANGQTVSLPSLFGVNTQNLLPTINFGFPSGFSAQSSGQGITGAAPTFGHDPRWPFVGTDLVQSITDKVTWIKGSHTIKAGFYYERMARNVAVYETYQPQGTYYFGSDKASPVDTGYPYSNLATGGFYAYGEDNRSRQINHARYNQEEWFVQDTWKINRRLTLDYGARFFVVGPLYSVGAQLGIFQGSAYDPKSNRDTLAAGPGRRAKGGSQPGHRHGISLCPARHLRSAVIHRESIFRRRAIPHEFLPYSTSPDRTEDRLGLGRLRKRQDRVAHWDRHHLRPSLERGPNRRGHRGHGPVGGAAEPLDTAHPQQLHRQLGGGSGFVYSTECTDGIARLPSSLGIQLEFRRAAGSRSWNGPGSRLCGQRSASYCQLQYAGPDRQRICN